MKPGVSPATTGRMLSKVWKAFKELNPNNVEIEAAREFHVGLVGQKELLQETVTYLMNNDLSAYQNAEDILILVSTPIEADALPLLRNCDIVLYSGVSKDELPGIDDNRMFEFSATTDIARVIKSILQIPELGYLHLPLAKSFPAIRDDVASEIIRTISIENALFVTSTSLGNVIPNPLQPLASVAGSMGDLVVLTANQLRMLFRLAAAYNKDLGYKSVYPEALSILGAAFGWRAVAREFVGQIPFGGGLLPKAAIAYAGTVAIGDGIMFYYKTGQRMDKEQMTARFDAAMQKGRETGSEIISKLKEAYAKGKIFVNKPGDDF